MRFPTIARRGIFRPLIPLTLEAPNSRQLMTDALVDTGADLTLFSQAYAAPLGLDLSSLPALPLTGAIGNVMTYRVLALVLELRRPPDLFRWRTSVGFVNGPMAYGVLGTKGFFEFFTMTYDAQAQTLDIVPNGPLPT